MNFFRILLSAVVMYCVAGCHSAQPQKPGLSDKEKSPPKQTVIKSNFSSVNADINSVQLIDSLQFVLSLHITSVRSGREQEAFTEVGQDITLSPQFVVAQNNTVILTNERNMRLLKLRDAKAGDKFSGKISLSPTGKRVIVDVETE